MKPLPLLAAPLASVVLSCVPLQAANAAYHFTGPSLATTSSVVPAGVTAGDFVIGGGATPTDNGIGTNPMEVEDILPAFEIVPEPTAAALGALGLILLLRHRRSE